MNSSIINKQTSRIEYKNLSIDSNPIFSYLPTSIINHLIDSGHVEKYHENDYLINEGDSPDCIYFILSGQLIVYKNNIEIDRQLAGAIIGEMGVLTGEKRSVSLKCASNVKVVKLESEVILEVLNEHKNLMWEMLNSLIDKLNSSHQIRVSQNSSLERVTTMLSKIVSPEVQENILASAEPEELLKGKLASAAIIFFDIQGFTSIAERLSPEILLQSINENLKYINLAVEMQGGVVVNYIGDAVLAVFNAPIAISNPVEAAVTCYIDATQNINSLSLKFKSQGKPTFQFGAGIHYGEVVTGAIGCLNRFNYTVLGNAVNLASRLEGLTRYYPVNLIYSEQCHEHLSPKLKKLSVQIDCITVKGQKEPQNIYSLLDWTEGNINPYQEGLKNYINGNFELAEELFLATTQELGKYMANRCVQLKKDNYNSWEGFFNWNIK